MIARYRNITTKPPKFFVPPKPPRFRVTVNQEGGQWTARLFSKWGQILEAGAGTATGALYELERRISDECVPETVAERQEAIEEVEAVVAMCHRRAAPRRSWQWRQAGGSAVERAMIGEGRRERG